MVMVLICRISLSANGADNPKQKPFIVFATDYGLKDDSVSQCKAVILGIAPDAAITDMTHDIPPFDVGFASCLLAKSAAFWPSGTILVAVVDPGVGTNRKAIALEDIMTKAGFIPFETEWWHFDYPGWEKMDKLDEPLPKEAQ